MDRTLAELLLAAIIALAAAVVLFMFFDRDEPAGTAPTTSERSSEPSKSRFKSDSEAGEDHEHFLAHGSRSRRYLVHVPKGHDGKRKLPVVLAFHGGGGKAESLRKQSRLNEVADRYGFLVVYPDGTGRSDMLTFNAGTCCGYAMYEKVDDVGFVSKLLDELPDRYPVDSRRVYATGISNGAMLCYRLAGELSDRIAAIGPVAGDMGLGDPLPQRPVPVIHFHGLKDQNIPFLGGKATVAYQPYPYRGVPDTTAWWLKADNCQAEPVETKEEKDFTMKRYAPAAGQPGAPVVLYTLPEGGHTWPGGVDVSAELGTGRVIESVNAGEIMWKFFEPFALPD